MIKLDVYIHTFLGIKGGTERYSEIKGRMLSLLFNQINLMKKI